MSVLLLQDFHSNVNIEEAKKYLILAENLLCARHYSKYFEYKIMNSLELSNEVDYLLFYT